MTSASVPNLNGVVPAAAEDRVGLRRVVFHAENAIAVARGDIPAIAHATLQATAQGFGGFVVDSHCGVLTSCGKFKAVWPVVQCKNLMMEMKTSNTRE